MILLSKKKIKKANLYITSKGMYEAYINGNKVGDFFLHLVGRHIIIEFNTNHLMLKI